jgi:hypothetical protein
MGTNEQRDAQAERSRFAVPLSELEVDRPEPDELVESATEPPTPDLIPEERRRLESFLKYGVGY